MNYKNKMSHIGKTGAKTICDILLNIPKIKHIFGYSGGSIISLFNELDNSKVKTYIGTHEQSCCHAAVGYAKSSNMMGVCISTSGPGVTNMVTSVYDAYCDGVPLLVLTGQVSKELMGTGAFQECPAVDIMKNVTKYSKCIENVNEIPFEIEKAINIAYDKRKGPVHLDLPKSTLYDKITMSEQNIYDKISNNVPFLNIEKNDKNETNDIILKAIEMIKQSKSPIFCIGQGCNEYSELVRKIAIKNNIFVTTTLLGNGIMDETHPLSLKFMGMHGSVVTNYAIQSSDCIIGIGYRFDDRTIGNPKTYALQAKSKYSMKIGGIINCNIRSNDFNKTVDTHYNINCDAGIFLKELEKHNLTNSRAIIYRDQTYDYISKLKKKHPFTYNKTNVLKTQDVIVEINNFLRENNSDFIISTGVGNHQMMTSQFIDWRKPKTFITSGSLGVMGVGLPFAIGAKLANPNVLVIDIDGDSSFNHTLSELKTIKTYNLPIKIAIMNDRSQTMVKMWEQIFFDKEYISTDCTYNPQYHKLAEAYDIHGIMCDKHENLKETISYFLNYDGPILCNFIVEGEMCLPFVAPGEDLNSNFDINKIKNKQLVPPS